MFLTIKRKSAIVAFSVALTIAIAVTISFAAAQTVSVPAIGKTIVIDAGHGGIDGGVVGRTNGVKESEINLAIARSLRHFFERGGYDVVMTRTSGDGLYGVSSSNKKRSDMERRRDIIKEAKPDMVISIHQNFYPLPSVSGAQVFYCDEGENAGEAAAEAIQSSLNNALGCSRTAKKGDYYVVKCTSYPSVIVECGFLSNPDEEKKLVTASYQEKVARAIYSAVHGMLGSAAGCSHAA